MLDAADISKSSHWYGAVSFLIFAEGAGKYTVELLNPTFWKIRGKTGGCYGRQMTLTSPAYEEDLAVKLWTYDLHVVIAFCYPF